MNTLVIYDSQYGNTEKIARQIADTLREFGAARAERVTAAELEIATIDLLIVGCPTQMWHTTPAMKNFLTQLQKAQTAHLCVAPFDTRLDKPGWLTGSAAKEMAKQLRHLDAIMLLPPESFLVTATEGPLAQGELERAAVWARKLHEAFERQRAPSAAAR